MTTEFNQGITDARKEIKKLDLLSITLDSLLIFLASLTLLTFLKIFWVFGIFPAIFHFVSRISKKSTDERAVEKVCKTCPEMDEKLKTAYDNKGGSNLIVNKLINEVSNEVDALEVSRFLNTKKISLKIFAVIACTFLFMLLSTFNFSIYALGINPLNLLSGINPQFSQGTITSQGQSNPNDWEESNYSNKEEQERLGGEGGGQVPGFSKGPIPGTGGGAGSEEGSDIFGEKSSAKISGQDVKMQIHPEYGGEIDIKEEKMQKFSQDVSITDAKGSELPNDEPLEYEEIIRRYFEKLLSEEKE